ncbi:MAG TPA: ABC transporter ATP-binding protein [Candidatus Nanoarchaeia archaeon]|nr:ABC transporter ATP-binding protein [Candidatus Nanoarchaeia archaeon]
MKEKVIIVNNLSKDFRIGFKRNLGALARFLSFFSYENKENQRYLKVLDNISFNLSKGEILGVIGNNGSGKSTLLRILAGIYGNYNGHVEVKGRIVPMIGLGQGMQERLTMRDNIHLIGSLFGLSRKSIKNKFSSIVRFSGLEKFVDTKVYQFSEGMKQRLAFSIIIHCNPDILLLDEIFAVGDRNFREKGIRELKSLVKEGTSIIFVSHDLWSIGKYCDKAILLEKGKIKAYGEPRKVLKMY